ncbi:hypothetical protein DPEC_G00299500 [Dallia pectoralis]|uniref:Uncharacterized protein n=1 Tax=Dallia pectoralis TaxID=75939 RepID=A0ACC2FGA4_DALPE|nr:hypothetical protein DPEC_G00299500 [Dallia pectoralis]
MDWQGGGGQAKRGNEAGSRVKGEVVTSDPRVSPSASALPWGVAEGLGGEHTSPLANHIVPPYPQDPQTSPVSNNRSFDPSDRVAKHTPFGPLKAVTCRSPMPFRKLCFCKEGMLSRFSLQMHHVLSQLRPTGEFQRETPSEFHLGSSGWCVIRRKQTSGGIIDNLSFTPGQISE